jgi:hypothetical protein
LFTLLVIVVGRIAHLLVDASLKSSHVRSDLLLRPREKV